MSEQIDITEIYEGDAKSQYAQETLERLSEWFGNKQALDEYATNVSSLPFWAAMNADSRCVGFIAVKTHYGHTGDIYVCGVLPEYHRRGVGKKLYACAEAYFIRGGCKRVIVKTLSDKSDYEPYARTRRFYESMGFEPLVTLTEMWDAQNPCLIMLKTLQAAAAPGVHD